MPRHQKTRRICGEPLAKEFVPLNNGNTEIIYLTYDEYEVIKRVDFEGKTHEECAKIMNISRTTTTEIYDKARKKLLMLWLMEKLLKSMVEIVYSVKVKLTNVVAKIVKK